VFFGGNNFDGYNSSRLEFYFCPDLDSGQRVDEFIVWSAPVEIWTT
jgi:hypothetical protein